MKEQYEMIDTIFRDILPEEGLNVREGQIELCKHICDVLDKRNISLSEAGVGLGKTYAYLVACIVNRNFRPVDERAKMNYTYHPSDDMPYVIATSSIELQKEIRESYIPRLSKILVKYGILDEPISVRMGKGKKNYICRQKLITYIEDIKISRGDKKELAELQRLLKHSIIDLDKAHIGLYDKKRISVSQCSKHCKYQNKCRYYDIKQNRIKRSYFFVICNHNYFIADLIHRKDNKKPLLPNYRAVIIDESHKYKDALRAMIMKSVDKSELLNLAVRLRKALKRCGGYEDAKESITALIDGTDILYYFIESQLEENINDSSNEHTIYVTEKIMYVIDTLRRELNIIKSILISKKATHLVPRIDETMQKLHSITCPNDYFYWAESEHKKISRICYAPYDYGNTLKSIQWNKSIPFVMTSGTLSIDGDFSYFTRTLCLDGMALHRLSTASYPSPYNYRQNCLFYYSDKTTVQSYSDTLEMAEIYIESLANEILELVNVTKGRTLVLFTSYKALTMVKEQVKDKISYPLIIAERGKRNAVEEFKSTDNAVMFSSNAWEGIDIQGEQLSSVIITKLPFPMPSKDSEQVRNQYPTFKEYLYNDIIPIMQIKLKQGFGRLVRHENDGGIIAILDARARNNGRYKEFVSECLPECRETTKISAVKSFIQKRDRINE